MVLGHESSGVMHKVGSAVSHLKPGDKTAMELGVPCRKCEYCRKGTYYNCKSTRFAAMPPTDGTFMKYYIDASDHCYKLSDNMDLEEGAMVESVSVAMSIVRTAGEVAGQTVIVMGCGPIGILTQSVAKACGASKVIGVDVVQSRLGLARSCGADEVYMSARKSPETDAIEHVEQVASDMRQRFGLGDGADFVPECSGAEPCVQLGVVVANAGATYAQAGMGKEVVAFPITAVCTMALTVKGSIRYIAGTYPQTIDLIASGKIDVKRLVTNRFLFEKSKEAFVLVKAGRPYVFKVMISGVP